MPRAASSGSSPKPTRHLIAGTFRLYFTIDVNGGAIRLPTVLYSLITGRSYCGTPSGYGGSAPRPLPPGASGASDADPDPTISSGGAPDPAGGRAPRPRPPAPGPRPPAASSTARPAHRCPPGSDAETTASVPCPRRRPSESRRRRSAARPPQCCSPDPRQRRRAPGRCRIRGGPAPWQLWQFC